MLHKLFKTGGDIAPQVFKPELPSPVRARHEAAADASGGKSSAAVPVRLLRDEHVFRRSAGKNRRQAEFRGKFAWHVLEAVDGHIYAAFQQGRFQFLDEDSLVHDAGDPGHIRQRHVHTAVSGGADDFPAYVQSRMERGQGGADHVRLGQGQGASAGADDEGVFTGHRERCPESIWRCRPG